MCGLCYTDGKLYTLEKQDVESQSSSHHLCVYQIQRDSGHITLLDSIELGVAGLMLPPIRPRVDRHSQRVFIPGDGGVTVARLDGDRLVRERTLTCVTHPASVDVMSPDTVYSCGVTRDSVYIVDVRDDRITSVLKNPKSLIHERPHDVAVLGDSFMVSYNEGPLVVYHHGSSDPVRVIPRTGGLSPSSISTDRQHHFLITDSTTNVVFVVDVSGDVLHKVNINTDSKIVDCAVVNRRLWVGCQNGDVVIMSSE